MNVLFTAWGYDVTWLELLAVVVAIVAVGLGIKGTRWTWPFYFVSSVLYGWLFLQWHLPASAAMQLIFIAAAVWGWFTWGREGVRQGRLSSRVRLGGALLVVVAWLVLAPLLQTIGGVATWGTRSCSWGRWRAAAHGAREGRGLADVDCRQRRRDCALCVAGAVLHGGPLCRSAWDGGRRMAGVAAAGAGGRRSAAGSSSTEAPLGTETAVARSRFGRRQRRRVLVLERAQAADATCPSSVPGRLHLQQIRHARALTPLGCWPSSAASPRGSPRSPVPWRVTCPLSRCRRRCGPGSSATAACHGPTSSGR